MNVDPESLLPKLPSPKDLRPFPTHVSVAYEGHTGMVRSVAVDATGQWIATASTDETVRIWEVSSGRPFRVLKFGSVATAVAWSPTASILAIAAEESLFFMDPGLEPSPEDVADGDASEQTSGSSNPTIASLLTLKAQDEAQADGDEQKTEGAKARAVRWMAVSDDSPLFSAGCRMKIPTDGDVQVLAWHQKGNYLAAVSPKAQAASNQCIIHALHQQKSMRPFSKMKGGAVQAAAFHPTKPHFVVATKTSVRIYDLQKQTQLKQLISGAKWIGSLTLHSSGDHVVAGSYDRRLVWFDLDFGSKPFKTLQYHDRAIRRAAFHAGKYPLLACASDDATISILHAKVSSDLMQGPLIVPVKRLREHGINQGFGVLDCAWHPTQPWLFTAGADHQVFLWA
jgi:ribosome biogenesis protein ERB1